MTTPRLRCFAVSFPPSLENPPKYFPSAVRGYEISVWSARMICFPDLLGDVGEGSPPFLKMVELDRSNFSPLEVCVSRSFLLMSGYLWDFFLNCNKNFPGFPLDFMVRNFWGAPEVDAPEGKTLHQTARQPLFGLRYFRVPNKKTSLCMYGILSIYLLYIS